MLSNLTFPSAPINDPEFDVDVDVDGEIEVEGDVEGEVLFPLEALESLQPATANIKVDKANNKKFFFIDKSSLV